jgi:phenylpropionate dioxygenase-like ring-hydroxylating dioxygenase large terminal subunit
VLLSGWYPAAPSADLAEPRDYVVWEQLEQSVVMVRLEDGSVSAWHNVCQHRGAKLVADSGRCPGGKFVCPWHGFVYGLDGRVTNVPLRPSFDPAQLQGLRAPTVRAVEWSGWVWLCFADSTPDLLEYLGDIGQELGGYSLDEYRVEHRKSVRLNANWKLVMDAFNETWHVPFTHKDTLSGTVRWREAILRITSPHSWMTIPVKGLTDRVRHDDHRQTHICHYLAFPNTIFSCFPNHLQMWSAWPVSVDETELVAYQFSGPTPAGMDEAAWARRTSRDWKSFLEVLDEDTEVVNDFAKVIGSKGYRRNMFNTAESRLTAFHDEVEKRLVGARHQH